MNLLVGELLAGIQAVLGRKLVGLYLDGSLANGGFDQDSDIDFVAVTAGEVTPEVFLALQAMHERLSALDTTWATELEGSYLSRRAVRRYDPACSRHPNIERGRRERLKWVVHTQSWDVHRWILHERGIVLSGPPPQTLVDPVSPEGLRRAMRVGFDTWAARFLDEPSILNSWGYQSYVVLTLCRMLYTLDQGAVASKPNAAAWARQTLDVRWAPLIERAWEGRHNPGEVAPDVDIQETMELIRYSHEVVTGSSLEHLPSPATGLADSTLSV